MSRHLAESKERLQSSNATCEHLEAQLEDLAKSNTSLRKARDTRQVAIEQKNKTIHDLQERVETLETELGAQSAKSEWRDSRCKSCTLAKLRGEEAAEVPSGAGARGEEEEALLREVEQLKLKQQQAELQHRRVSKELQDALADNQTLTLSLEKAEGEGAVLQARLKYYEDAFERQNGDMPLMSPKCCSHNSTPKHVHVTRFPFGLPGSPQGKAPQGNDGGTTVAGGGGVGGGGGMSLFSELDSHCSHLQNQYEDLLGRCICSASVPHRENPSPSLDTTPAPVAGHGEEEDGRPTLEIPLRELFDAVFSTLRETAQVADRLIERRC